MAAASMFEYTIYPDGGEPYEISCGTRDVLAWERAGKGRTSQDLVTGSATATYSFLHAAATRQKLFSGSLADFEASVDLLAGHHLTASSEGEDDAAVPTNPDL